MSDIPQGYIRLRPTPGLTLVLRENLEDAVNSQGLDSFPEPGRAAVAGIPASGRAPVRRVTVDHGPPLILKHYRRGGLLGRLRGDRYGSNSRAWSELRVCAEAARAGLPVPPIEIFWIQRMGAFSYRFAAATREIAGAEDLFRALHRLAGDEPARRRLLGRVAAVIRAMHDAGIDHPDLNLGNILLARGEGWGGVHLIDFDKATRQDGPLAADDRHHALNRLYRSLVKLSLPGEPAISAEEKSHFISTYFGDDTDRSAALRRQCSRSLTFHRLWWRISPPGPREPES